MGRLEALIWSCEDPCTMLLCYEKRSVRKTRQYVKERFVSLLIVLFNTTKVICKCAVVLRSKTFFCKNRQILFKRLIFNV